MSGINLKVTTDSYSGSDLSWLKHQKGFDTARSITLDLSTFLAAHYANGKIPSGTVLGKITASGKYGPYDNAAGDGRTTAAGFLLFDVRVQDAQGNALADPGCALLWEGIVDETKLPAFAGTTLGEIDANGKTDLKFVVFE
jgi:hypothetical protein